MDLLFAALAGIGIAMLWQRAEPVKPVHNWVIIRLNRLHDWLAVRRWPKFPIWWLKGVLGCESCLAPWIAPAMAIILGERWYSLLAMPIAFAIYNLCIQSKDHANSGLAN